MNSSSDFALFYKGDYKGDILWHSHSDMLL